MSVWRRKARDGERRVGVRTSPSRALFLPFSWLSIHFQFNSGTTIPIMKRCCIVILGREEGHILVSSAPRAPPQRNGHRGPGPHTSILYLPSSQESRDGVRARRSLTKTVLYMLGSIRVCKKFFHTRRKGPCWKWVGGDPPYASHRQHSETRV